MFKNISLLTLILFLGACVPTGEEAKLSFRAPSALAERAELRDYNSELQMAPRTYVASVLYQVFNAKGTSADAYIKSDIMHKIEFGGACDQYATDEDRNEEERCKYNGAAPTFDVVQKSTNNPMRYSITTKVCEKLVKDDARLIAVRSKLYSGNDWRAPTIDTVTAAWDLFYPATPIDSGVAQSLLNMKNVTSSHQEAWQTIVLTLCISPGWQTFN